MRRLPILVLSLAALTCNATRTSHPDSHSDARIGIRRIASGFSQPIGLVAAHDGTGRLFVIEQQGRIRILDRAGNVQPGVFLDVTSKVACCGEQGLLGLAFHPQYEANGFFFVNYTDRSGDTVVSRYRVSSDPSVADAASESVLLRVDQPFSNHNGGHLLFGPDGFLYIGLGDGGSGGDPGNRAQNLGDLLGKMLRIDVSGNGAYTIPSDNPFLGIAGARPEIWSYGLRNPWRYSFDRDTGDLWIADVGQGEWEEINFQPAASSGGENYGWRRMEGNHCFNPSSGCDTGSLVRPVAEYNHDRGRCSVTGGYVYRGPGYPAMRGLYIYGDFCSGTIFTTRRAGSTFETSVAVESGRTISSFGEAEDGELYLTDYSGAIYRVIDENNRRTRSVRRGN